MWRGRLDRHATAGADQIEQPDMQFTNVLVDGQLGGYDGFAFPFQIVKGGEFGMGY